MLKYFRLVLITISMSVFFGCDNAGFSGFGDSQFTLSSIKKPEDLRPTLDLGVLVENLQTDISMDLGFKGVIIQALDQDPGVLSAKNETAALRARSRTTESGRDIQLNAMLLGGIEDVSDETAGVAAILAANRMLFDGGKLEAQLSAEAFEIKASEQAYLAIRARRALDLVNAWIDLERYQGLEDLINTRLSVLDPLLVQLEKVAEAGVGDVSQVASAKRIVSMILIAETEVLVRLEQAKISFISGFGRLPSTVSYDASLVSNAVPTTSTKELLEKSPGLQAQYLTYKAAVASIAAIELKDSFSVALQASLKRPFGGSATASDESIGLVLTKDFYQGEQLKSQINRAEQLAHARASQVFAGYRQGELAILAARETIKSMDKAIILAQENTENVREEIDYLRKQLVIGGSTLEAVLSAEARLYEAESKEIEFIAKRRKAETTIVAISGYF